MFRHVLATFHVSATAPCRQKMPPLLGVCAETGASGQEQTPGLELIHLMQRVVEDGVLIPEPEVPTELLLLKQQWEPVAVVWPHVCKGDLVQLEPLRAHFWGRG